MSQVTTWIYYMRKMDWLTILNHTIISEQDPQKNELNRVLGHLCAHIGETGPGEPPEDGEMIEMTLSSRHRMRNSSPGGLRPSTLLLGHGGSPQYWLSHVDGEETFFVSFKPPRPGTELRTLAWKAAVLTTTLGPPPAGPAANTGYGACVGLIKENRINDSIFLGLMKWNEMNRALGHLCAHIG